MGALVADGRLGDVIVAPATPPGVSALAVVRLSGPEKALAEVAGRLAPGLSLEDPRLIQRVRLVDAEGEPLDDATGVVFRGPRSPTGEDVVELFCHGSPAIVSGLLAAARRAGARPAAPGEFTRRALMNGKLDLAEAEGIAHLSGAASRGAARRALGLATGRLSERVGELREELLDLLASLEAELDFPEDVGEEPTTVRRARLAALEGRIAPLLAAAEVARSREGLPRVAILGRPNAGKSSLFNALVGSDRAIVSPRVGTTRDIVSEEIELAAERVKLLDTAGLAETAGEIERIGVELARRAGEESDLVLYAVDVSVGIAEEDRAALAAHPGRAILVGTKADLGRDGEDAYEMEVSATEGTGLPELRVEISRRLGLLETAGELLVLERHREALERTAGDIRRCDRLLAEGAGVEFAALELRGALAALGEIGGETATEELLDRIFATFCVGK